MDLVINNGKVVTPQGVFQANIGIEGEKIATISRSPLKGDEVIDASGKLVMPGVIDPHVHMELPFGGTVSADDFKTGTIAGAFGGVTTIIDFAIQPNGESPFSAIEARKKAAERKVVVDFALHASLTDMEKVEDGDIRKIIEMGLPSFKLFMTYRKEGLMVDDGTLFALLQETASLKGLVGVHAENAAVLEYLITKFLREGRTEPKYHALSRPNFVEGECINRAITLTEEANSSLYIFHMSTKEGLEAVKSAKTRGVNVLAETCPHYLMLTDEKYEENGQLYVMSPPLRKREDNEALWQGVINGWIDVVSTDHCPFRTDQKAMGDTFDKIPNGVPGIETLLPVMFSEGLKRGMTPERLVEVLSYNPARIFGLESKGAIEVGKDADIVILDPREERTLSYETLHMNLDYSIFEGLKVKGYPVTTISRGEVIVDNNEFYGKEGRGRFIERVSGGW